MIHIASAWKEFTTKGETDMLTTEDYISRAIISVRTREHGRGLQSNFK